MTRSKIDVCNVVGVSEDSCRLRYGMPHGSGWMAFIRDMEAFVARFNTTYGGKVELLQGNGSTHGGNAWFEITFQGTLIPSGQGLERNKLTPCDQRDLAAALASEGFILRTTREEWRRRTNVLEGRTP